MLQTLVMFVSTLIDSSGSRWQSCECECDGRSRFPQATVSLNWASRLTTAQCPSLSCLWFILELLSLGSESYQSEIQANNHAGMQLPTARTDSGRRAVHMYMCVHRKMAAHPAPKFLHLALKFAKFSEKTNFPTVTVTVYGHTCTFPFFLGQNIRVLTSNFLILRFLLWL